MIAILLNSSTHAAMSDMISFGLNEECSILIPGKWGLNIYILEESLVSACFPHRDIINYVMLRIEMPLSAAPRGQCSLVSKGSFAAVR